MSAEQYHPELQRRTEILRPQEFLSQTYDEILEDALSQDGYVQHVEFPQQRIGNWEKGYNSRERGDYVGENPFNLVAGSIIHVGDIYVGLAMGNGGYRESDEVTRFQYGISRASSYWPPSELSRRVAEMRRLSDQGIRVGDPRFKVTDGTKEFPQTVQDLVQLVRDYPSAYRNTGRIYVSEGSMMADIPKYAPFLNGEDVAAHIRSQGSRLHRSHITEMRELLHDVIEISSKYPTK